VHLRGRHKAKLFASALGFTQANAKDLKAALLIAARDYDCVAGKANRFGKLYEIEFVCAGPGGRASLLSIWIIEHSELFPRLVTCYPI